MKFKLPDSYYEKQKEIYELKYIEIDGEKVHVSELEDKSVTPEMKEKMRMNSYAQEDMPPKMTDETLVETAEYYLSQCSTPRIPCSTYDEALIHRILPEMIERLKENQRNERE